MRTFASYELYLEALKGQPELAILPLGAASKIFSKGDRTIKAWIMSGRLDGVRIGADIYPLAYSIIRMVDQREREVNALYERLIEHVLVSESVLFYSELMAEFGYNHRSNSDRNHFGFLLGDASRKSQSEMRGNGMEEGYFISSYVWRKPRPGKDPSEIGEGFWTLVEWELDEVVPKDRQEEFIKTHMKKCRKYYRRTRGR